jgi:ubiquilin
MGGAGQNPFGGQMPSPESLQQMLDNPMMQQFLSANSEQLRNVMASELTNHPEMQQAMERNPELRHALDAMLSDPENIRRTIEMMRNPNYEREMLRISDQAVRNIETLPGGYNFLHQMYEDVQQPLFNAAQDMFTRGPAQQPSVCLSLSLSLSLGLSGLWYRLDLTHPISIMQPGTST